MVSAVPRPRPEPLLVRSGAAIYAGAAAIGAIDAAIPGGPRSQLLPGIGALVMVALVTLLGPRLPRAALAGLGPIGAVLIAFAVATSSGFSDAAILYSWPVLWVAYFYGTRPTAIVVGSIGVGACRRADRDACGGGQHRPLVSM